MKYSFSSAFRDALIASVMTAIIVAPVFSLHLERAGMRTNIVPDWRWTIWACIAVFVVQMLKPLLAGKMPKVSLPALPQMKSGTRNVVVFVVLMMAASWPFFAGRNAVDIATLAMIYVMLGLGLNMVVGFAGLLDLGFVGFYAVGAYTYALLFHWAGWSFWQALPLAGAASALFGFVLGFPVLRLRGDYLAIVTLGFGEIIRLLLVNLTDWTGGPDGISCIPKPTVFGLPMTRSPMTEGGTTFHQFFGLEFNSMHMVIFLYLMALLLAMVTLHGQQALRTPDHHENHDQTEDQHAVFREFAGHFGQYGQDDGGEDDTQLRAHATQHHDGQNQGRFDEGEGLGVHNALARSKERTAKARKHGAQREGREFDLHGVQAQRTAGDFVFAQRFP